VRQVRAAYEFQPPAIADIPAPQGLAELSHPAPSLSGDLQPRLFYALEQLLCTPAVSSIRRKVGSGQFRNGQSRCFLVRCKARNYT
jgi:hypothetical protein